MKKSYKITALLLVISILITLMPAMPFAAPDMTAYAASSGTCGSNLVWELDDDGSLTISGTGAMSDYTTFSNDRVPWYDLRSSITKATINEGVTSIGAAAFYGCENLTSISIADSVASVGAYAFYYCSSLEDVVIPNGVPSIAEYAFGYCGDLESITLPDSIASVGMRAFYNCDSLTGITIPNGVTSIGNGAFYNCDSITDITIPNGVTSIGDSVFVGCDGLTALTIPNNVTSIGNSAFYDCDNLTSITIPNSVISIGDSAFYTCSALASITIPNSVTYIGNSAFYDCDNLTGITIPNSITAIGNRVFEGCDGLTSITIPNSVTSIGNSVFSGCSSLTDITIPNSVTSIGHGAFMGCAKLDNVVIPDSVSSIGGSAFNGCVSLKEITLSDNITELDSYIFGGCKKLADITIPESVVSINDYAFSSCTGLKNITIPTDVAYIGKYAFSQCTDLGSFIVDEDNAVYGSANGALYLKDSMRLILAPEGVSGNFTIPAGILSIGDYAFNGCSDLTGITIPNSVTSIGQYAFSGCEGLTGITIPNSVTSIGQYAFSGCEGLTGITIPNSVTSIGHYAFYYCDNLTSITIPDSVTSIGDSAFSYCASLTSITIPDSVTFIGDRAFSCCSALTSIAIPDSVTSIGDGAFIGCSSLTSITIPDSVTSIGDSAFIGCSSLTSITIPDSVTSIGDSAFCNCDSLTDITIPDSVTSIGQNAFSGCEGLTGITIPNSVTSIAGGTFSGCESLTGITIPGSVTSIGQCAFSNCDSITDITILDGVTSISSYAFNYCSELESITVPASVTNIGRSAFYGCDALETVYYAGTQEQWNAINLGSDNGALANATIYYNGETGTAIPAPVAPVVTATAIGDDTVSVSWTYSGSMDYVMSFTLYRSNDGEQYFYSRQIDADKSTYTDTLSYDGTEATYYYKVIVTDKYSRTCESNVASVTLRITDTEKPVPAIEPATLNFAAVNEAVAVSGGLSTDNEKITGWEWDFGDGSKSSGKSAAHIYDTAGNYTITLTVTDSSGNSASTSKNITVVDALTDGFSKLQLTVCDARTLVPVTNAQVTISSDSYSGLWPVGSDGILNCVLPDDVYTVSVCSEDYLVRTVKIMVAGGETSYTISLTTGSIMTGEITVEELTYDEIVDAGIDVNAEGNSHVYKFETKLTFIAGAKTYDIPVVVHKNEKGEVVKRESVPFTFDDEEGNTHKGWSFPLGEELVLVIYGEARWLKEMFKVELIMLNNSNTDTLEFAEASLQLPDGLSLADMLAGPQSLTQSLDTIGYSSSKSACWFIRGDKEGEYFITAKASAVSMPFNEKIEQTYTTDKPIKVYAGSALHMTITADDVAERGANYSVKYKLENVSDKTLYNLSFGITGSEQYKVVGLIFGESVLPITSCDFGDSFTQKIDELAPGGFIELELSTTIWFNSILELVSLTKFGAFFDVAYYLTDISVTALEGSTTQIPYTIEINRTEKDSLIDKVVNEVGKKVFSDITFSKDLGGTLIELAGEVLNIDSIPNAKSVLKLAQGETDYVLTVSIDDGQSDSDSIYNDVVRITTGDTVSSIVDTLNGTKIKAGIGGITIQAKGPGSTKFKVGVENKFGELEREYVVNYVVDDEEVKSKLTVGASGVSGSYSVDEDKLSFAIKEKREEEKALYASDPYLWFDSSLVFELEQTTSDSNYSLSMTADQLGDILNNTMTTSVEVKGSAVDLIFDRDALMTIAEENEGDVIIAARRLGDEEAEKAGFDSSSPVYQFTAQSGSNRVTNFGDGEVYIKLPYELPDTSEADSVYVEHIRDDGSTEILDAVYDSTTKTISFVTDGFSYFRICKADDTANTTTSTTTATTAAASTTTTTTVGTTPTASSATTSVTTISSATTKTTSTSRTNATIRTNPSATTTGTTVPNAASSTTLTTATSSATSATTVPTTVHTGVNVSRLQGSDRFETAAEISSATFESAESVIIVSGDNYADGLSGVPLAYALDAPILLVRGELLSGAVKSEIRRLGARNAYILGGEIAVSRSIADQLEGEGMSVERIWGETRFETAVAIAEKLLKITNDVPEVFFAYAYNYPDALAISNIAAIKGCPIIYIAADGKLSSSTKAFIKSCGVKRATILGGTVAVSSDAEDNIRNAGISMVNRIAGNDRYDTCLRINQSYTDILTGDVVCIATGLDYPDSLTGGVAAAKNKAPLVLSGKSLTDEQINYLKSRNPDAYCIFGGAAAVSADVEKQLP